MAKSQLSLVPIEALEACADAFADGSRKYGRNSFTTMDIEWSQCIDSLLRHVHAFASGEDVASDSGVSHLGHAMARCAMLIYWQKWSVGTDNRRLVDPPALIEQSSDVLDQMMKTVNSSRSN